MVLAAVTSSAGTINWPHAGAVIRISRCTAQPGAAPHPINRTAAPQNTMGPLRIALLGYRSHPFSGGQGIYLKYLSRALTELGHRVEVISGEPYPELDPGVALVRLPGLNLFAEHAPRNFKPAYLRSLTDLYEWSSVSTGGFPEPYTFGRRVYDYLSARRGHYDIIHDNQCLSYGTLRLQQSGLPLVTTIHHPITYDRDIALDNAPNLSMRLLIRRWHRFLNMQTRVAARLRHIVTVSESAKGDICDAFAVDPQRVEVIYNGVDGQIFRPSKTVVREPMRLITTASADQPLKGARHLLTAFASLRQEFPTLRLSFVGRANPGGATATLIEELKLAPYIDFHQGIGTDALVELYARAAVAVVPSDYEGFGLPAAEAMACATPLVATRGGALAEVVGDAGILVPTADPEALRHAIRELLLDDKRRRQLGQLGRQRMLSTFSWEQAALRLSDYYQELLQS